jgi:hypothetical protein
MMTPSPVKDRVKIEVIAVKLPRAVKTESLKPDCTAFVIHNKELGPGDAVSTNTARK